MNYLFERDNPNTPNRYDAKLLKLGEYDLEIDGSRFEFGAFLRDSVTKYVAIERVGKRREVVAEVDAHDGSLLLVDATVNWED